MNKEQQIEEMAKMIFRIDKKCLSSDCGKCRGKPLPNCFCMHLKQCETLYKAGWRKASENEVIISKEELKRREKNYKIGLGKSQSWVKKLKSNKEQLESENFNLQRTIDTNHEEMAKEIYKEARERVNEGIEWLNCSKDKPGNKYMKGVTFGLNLFDKALINAIKKYGVEVKE